MNKLLVVCSSLLILNGSTVKKEKERLLSAVCDVENSQPQYRNDSFLTHTPLVTEVKQKSAPKKVVWKCVNDPKVKKGNELDLTSVTYIEEEEDPELGFDTKQYLPEGFNPYAYYLDINSLQYVEEEEPVEVGFDTKKYLPKGFNPYEPYFDLHSINYIEEETEVKFDYDTRIYLPVNFNPYAVPFDLKDIRYIEEDEEIDMGFDTKKYLPKGFDAYTKPTLL